MKRLIFLSLVLILSLAIPASAFANDFPGKNWATYFTYTVQTPSGGPAFYTLVAGQHYDVGSVKVWNDSDKLYVEYIIDVPNVYLLEVHVAVADNLSGIPQKNGNPIPGKFPYGASFSAGDNVTDYTVEIPLDGFGDGDTVLIAAHAALSNGETAWGDGQEQHQWPAVMSLAFEDLPTTSSNDWDYNDWVTDFRLVATYNGADALTQLDFNFTSQARGAAYNHDEHLKFTADTFSSNGTYRVIRYASDNSVLNDTGVTSFNASANVDLLIFQNTQSVLPANSGVFANTVDGSGTQAGGYTDVVITFDSPFAFTLPDISSLGVHGQGLFFDPYLHVINTGENIHVSDARLLLVPTDWKWPQERAAIWTAYTTGITSGNPPTFTDPLWYTYPPNDYIWDPVNIAP